MRRANPIVEFVGVPGSGKSTIARAFRPLLPNAIGLQLPPGAFRGSPSLLAHAAALLMSLRPFRSNDIHRMVRIVEAQRVYAQPLAAPLLLEQGLIQRLWAILADRESFSEIRLDSLIGVMAKTPPDIIVRVNTPYAVAASRIHARPRGNSRYERLAEAEITARLGPADALYDRLVDLYRRHSAAVVIAVPGTDPVEENVARIAACLAEARA
jgi:energy-coupling factor transporter ATP-binding protein EcfA2